jgi:hypothetical protein
MRQFKGTDWSLNDQLTVAPDYLKKSIAYIRGLFAMMIQKVQTQQQNQKPGAATSHPTAGQLNKVPLNASNLQQHQQQEEAIQRARRTHNQATPAAPTAAQPPFPLGAPSPQGVPQAYGPGGFSPEKLKIPPSKRRKPSHAAGATPVTPSGLAPTTQAIVDASKAPGGESRLFKCSVLDCDYHQYGFPTQVALDKHIEENHRMQEHIEDPLQYALESFHSALAAPAKEKEKLEIKNLKKPAAATADASRLGPKSAISSAVKQEIKAEGTTPTTVGTTPMGRVPSQMGTKSASPASYQLPTPRTVAAKAPSNVKPAMVKSGKKDVPRSVDPTVVPEDIQLKDGWLDSSLSLDLISETFDAAMNEDYHGLGGDPFDEFLNVDMFTVAQAEDTPDSIDSGGIVTQTPKDGELVKDDLEIKVTGLEDDGLLPADWFSHPGPLTDNLITEDPWADIDWNALERKDADLIPSNDSIQNFLSI